MNVYLDTVGCRLNQSEIETYARQLRLAGHCLVASPQQADLVVLNTCAVTAEAASDSRQKARQAARQGARQIVLTGCWATLQPGEAANLPGISQVIGNLEKDQLVAQVLQLAPQAFDLQHAVRQPIPGARHRTRAFIKAQDGCNNRCTFCVTTIARGPSRSRSLSAVLADVEDALQGGTQEIVLTGVHLGSWGRDFAERQSLGQLVQSLLEKTSVPRLRLSSLEPWDIEEHFFDLWQDERLCPHLHLPLQSGSAATLRRMARKTTPAAYADLLKTARSAIPGLAVTTDIIVGFPGESEAEFEESLAFIQEMQFAGGHVFNYSARPSTAAAAMPDQVPQAVRKARSAQVRQVLAQAAQAYLVGFLDRNVNVLWESIEADGPGWALSGLTGNYLRVHTRLSGSDPAARWWNQITPVRVTGHNPTGLLGQILTI
ncbi:MAG TPA: tRNA (N(6)-L-threonylcarbamoyladenosine(37)-C(2))-methylthiotransferase MtaB [Anaerolineales bacterium]|nr:tRNA (N(6)-L-threonylcarbamoyladenosine(37)-C(2))-methylthiotransferase MtaB [Anaerolineales bacterium]